MSDTFDVTRATAIIEHGINSGWVETMPQSDGDKIMEAEKLVELARQVEAVKDSLAAQGGEEAAIARIPHWPGVESILMEANLFVGSNGDHAEQGGGFDVTAPQDGSASVDATSVGQPVQEAPVEVPDSLPSAPPPSGEERETTGTAESAPPPVAPPSTSPGGPVKDEVWADAQGVEWRLLGDGGGMTVEAMKVSTGESTVAPAGMLKRRVSPPVDPSPMAVALQEDHEGDVSKEETPEVIDDFSGKYHFLSNFSHSPIEIDDVVYPTVEHAFQAYKTLDPELHRVIAASPTPGEAKRAGRQVALREGWDAGLRVDVMRACLELKFAPDSDMLRRLKETAPVRLVEGNTWGDTYWGVCDGVGENMLGQLLEEIRDCEEETAPETDIAIGEPEVVIAPDPGVPDHDDPVPAPETSTPDHDDEGDDLYQELLGDTESRYTPTGMPIPTDLADPPDVKPENFDEVDDRTARMLHSKYNALAARAKYLHDVEDSRARGCAMIRKLHLRGAMREARKQLGSSATVTEVQAWAEEIDNDVSRWGDRAQRHSDEASAYKTFFDIYTQHVVVLSRDWTMRDRQMNS